MLGVSELIWEVREGFSGGQESGSNVASKPSLPTCPQALKSCLSLPVFLLLNYLPKIGATRQLRSYE